MMKSEIINVSFENKLNNLSYPIFVGTDLIPNSGEILKNFIQDRKILLIHDNFFSLKQKKHERFITFVKLRGWVMSTSNDVGLTPVKLCLEVSGKLLLKFLP